MVRTARLESRVADLVNAAYGLVPEDKRQFFEQVRKRAFAESKSGLIQGSGSQF
jgi:hypothetical protein